MDCYKMISDFTGISAIQLRKADTGGIRSLLRDFSPDDCTAVQYEKLVMLRSLLVACLVQPPTCGIRLQDSKAWMRYCSSFYSGFEDQEMMYAVYLDAQREVLAAEMVSAGTRLLAMLPADVILRRALLRSAAQILLCSNCTGNWYTVSKYDKICVMDLQKLCAALGIVFLDHVVVTGSGAVSMAEEGVLQ